MPSRRAAWDRDVLIYLALGWRRRVRFICSPSVIVCEVCELLCGSRLTGKVCMCVCARYNSMHLAACNRFRVAADETTSFITPEQLPKIRLPTVCVRSQTLSWLPFSLPLFHPFVSFFFLQNLSKHIAQTATGGRKWSNGVAQQKSIDSHLGRDQHRRQWHFRRQQTVLTRRNHHHEKSYTNNTGKL